MQVCCLSLVANETHGYIQLLEILMKIKHVTFWPWRWQTYQRSKSKLSDYYLLPRAMRNCIGLLASSYKMLPGIEANFIFYKQFWVTVLLSFQKTSIFFFWKIDKRFYSLLKEICIFLKRINILTYANLCIYVISITRGLWMRVRKQCLI